MNAIALAVLLAAAAPPASAPPPAPAKATAPSPVESDTAAVQALLQAQAAAWTKGDLEAFCAVYADDAVFLSPSGLTKTRQAVYDRYKAKYQDKGRMGALTLDVLDARATPGAVTVALRWTISYPDGKPATGLSLVVLHAHAQGWRIVHDASM